MLVVAFDCETSKKPILNPWQKGSFLSSVGIITNKGDRKYWVFAHQDNKNVDQRQNIKEIQEWINKADLLVAHNIKFDINWLRWIGIKVPNNKLFCTSVAEYMIKGQRPTVSYKLGDTAKRYSLPVKLDKVAEYWDAGYDTDEVPLSILIEYMMRDVELTLALYMIQKDLLMAKNMVKLAKYCFEVSGILSEAEVAGFDFDKDMAEHYVEELTDVVKADEDRLSEIAGFEVRCTMNQKLSVAMFGGKFKGRERVKKRRTLKSGRVKETEVWQDVVLEYPGIGIKPVDVWKSDKTGYYSCKDDALKMYKARTKIQKEFITTLQRAKKNIKVIQTFYTEKKDSSSLLKNIGKDGRVHPQFNQTVTVTGRLSSKKPNGQNLPRKGTSPIKKTIKSRNGRIVNVDLGQIEWRMAGEMAKDSRIIYEVCHGVDAHSANAMDFFGSLDYRQDAKVVTFGLIYGRTKYGFYNDSKMPDFTLNRWDEIITAFFKKYSGLKRWQDRNYATVVKQGYLQNFSGRVLTFNRYPQRDGSKSFKKADICNYPVQSISADMMFVAMAHIMRRVKAEGLKSEFIIQVHDSMVFDAYENEIDRISQISIEVFESLPELVEDLFGHKFDLPITGDVEVGLTYGDIVEYNVYRHAGAKYLYKFLTPDNNGNLKEKFMWVLKKSDILKKFEQASEIKLLDTVNPTLGDYK